MKHAAPKHRLAYGTYGKAVINESEVLKLLPKMKAMLASCKSYGTDYKTLETSLTGIYYVSKSGRVLYRTKELWRAIMKYNSIIV